MKFNVPLSMSCVSMQDDPDKKTEVVHENLKRGLSFVEQSNNIPVKVERSRTFVNSGRYRTRGQKVEAMLMNSSPKVSADLIPNAVSIDRTSVLQTSSLGSTKEMFRPIVNDLPKHKHSNNDSKISEKVHSSHTEKVQSSIERHHSTLENVRNSGDRGHSSNHKHHSSQEKLRHLPENRALPKPKPPSQQYLKESISNTPYGSRSLPSPKTAKEISREFDHDPEWLTRR